MKNNNGHGLSPWEFACVSGRPLPDIQADMRNGKIPYEWIDGERRIPFSFLYPTLCEQEFI